VVKARAAIPVIMSTGVSTVSTCQLTARRKGSVCRDNPEELGHHEVRERASLGSASVLDDSFHIMHM
jgi:hypothetical protein